MWGSLAWGGSQYFEVTTTQAVGDSRLIPFVLKNAVGGSRLLPSVRRNTTGGSRLIPYVIISHSGSSRLLPFVINGEFIDILPSYRTGNIEAQRSGRLARSFTGTIGRS